MKRFVFFIILLILPTLFGFWLFIPLAFLYACIAKNPLELIPAGAIIDSLTSINKGIFLQDHTFSLISLALAIMSFGISEYIHWRKLI